MKGLARLFSMFAAIAAMLSASAWSSGAAACQIPPGLEMITGGAPSNPDMRTHHHHKAKHRPVQSKPDQGPAGPRLDCAACVAVLPSFPAVGSQELMPLVPTAQTFKPLFGIDPLVDPPPPRRADPAN